MKIKILFLFLLITGLNISINEVKAQSSIEDTTVYKVPDVSAEFPGGQVRMNEYIDFRLNGRQSGSYTLNEGVIEIEFIVEKDGKIKQVRIIKSLDPIFDQNFMDLIKGMPKWKPAKIAGQPVRSLKHLNWEMNYYMSK